MKQWWSDCKTWIPLVLRERASREENWYLKQWWKRGWFTSKALISLVFYLSEDRGRYWYHPDDHFDEGVEVAHGNFMATHSMDFGEGCEFDYLMVPHRGIGYAIGSTGYP